MVSPSGLDGNAQRNDLNSYVTWSQAVDSIGLAVVVATILMSLVLLRKAGGRIALISRNAAHLGAEEPLEPERTSDELGQLASRSRRRRAVWPSARPSSSGPGTRRLPPPRPRTSSSRG